MKDWRFILRRPRHSTKGFDPKFTNEGTALDGTFADKAPIKFA